MDACIVAVRASAIGSVILMLVGGVAAAQQVDYTCMNRCTQQGYLYGLCQSRCSYGSAALPVYAAPPTFSTFDLGGAIMQAEAIKQQRMQREQADAQRRLIEEQARAQQIENQRRQEAMSQRSSAGQAAQIAPNDMAVYEKWMRAAAPRVSLYPDFWEVIGAPDVACSVQMVELMASSPYAADIAYYLGKNKARSLEIAQMPLLEQAVAIREIEQTVARK